MGQRRQHRRCRLPTLILPVIQFRREATAPGVTQRSDSGAALRKAGQVRNLHSKQETRAAGR